MSQKDYHVLSMEELSSLLALHETWLILNTRYARRLLPLGLRLRLALFLSKRPGLKRRLLTKSSLWTSLNQLDTTHLKQFALAALSYQLFNQSWPHTGQKQSSQDEALFYIFSKSQRRSAKAGV